MPLLQGTTLDPSSAGSPDGSFPVVNLGRANEALVAQLHGKYFTQCYRGNVFYASTTTAGRVLSLTTVTPTYSIWNPAGSGKLCIPFVTLIGWTATNAALGEIVWMATTNAGDTITTAGVAPLSAFGTGTPLNANLGSGKVSAMRIATAGTTTLTAVPTFYRSTGLSMLVTVATTATAAPGWVWRDDWDGGGIIPPGNVIHLMASTAIAIAACVTTAYVEVPL